MKNQRTISKEDLQQRRDGGSSVVQPLVERAPDPAKMAEENKESEKHQVKQQRHEELTQAIKSNNDSVTQLSTQMGKHIAVSNEIAVELAKSQTDVVDDIRQMLIKRDSTQAFRLTVHRDKDGLIETIDMFPIGNV